jgi:hypothetical protein
VVEDYLDVYLRTPDLPKDDIARALVARGRARKGAGQRLLLMASRGPSKPSSSSTRILPTVFYHPSLTRRAVDFQTASTFDPSNPELQFYRRREPAVRPLLSQSQKHEPLSFSPFQLHFSTVFAPQRLPPEIWDQIASFIPRYFLPTWLFVSSFHRDTALRRIFRTVDLYLCEESDSWNRTLDIFDGVKVDPVFSRRIKTPRSQGSRGIRVDRIPGTTSRHG